jgi:hypothetical protein
MDKATKKLMFNTIQDGDSAVVLAILQDNLDAMEAIGEHNAHVRDKTPLMFALQCANLRLANALLDRGANACAVMPDGPRDSVLEMCVSYAYYRDGLEHDEWIGLATRLLDLGAEPTSALPRAVLAFTGGFVKRADLIRLLLNRGANPGAQAGNSGCTVRELVEVNRRLYSNEVLDLFHIQPASDHDLKDAEEPATPPFMSHPSGECETPVDAMADAIKRLRALSEWDKWITFCAQGMGPRVDSYHFASIRMRRGEITFFVKNNMLKWTEKHLELDIPAVTKRAGVPESCLSKTDVGYSVAKATPIEAARILDVIFRQYMGIRPHTGEGDGYAIGAEW